MIPAFNTPYFTMDARATSEVELMAKAISKGPMIAMNAMLLIAVWPSLKTGVMKSGMRP